MITRVSHSSGIFRNAWLRLRMLLAGGWHRGNCACCDEPGWMVKIDPLFKDPLCYDCGHGRL
jgi:hypothetical protein